MQELKLKDFFGGKVLSQSYFLRKIAMFTKNNKELKNLASKNNNFDLIRLLAAFFVLISHAIILSGQKIQDPFNRVSHYSTFGGLGVAIFFSLSGFLITKSFCRSPLPMEYIKKRFLRIVPGYIGLIFITVFIIGPIVTVLNLNEYLSDSQTYAYLYNLSFYDVHYRLPGVFVNNHIKDVNGSIWSLSYEVSMYVLILILGITSLLRFRFVLVMFFTFCVLNELTQAKVLPIKIIMFQQTSLFFELAVVYFQGSIMSFLDIQKITEKIRGRVIFGAALLILFLLANSHLSRFAFTYIIPWYVVLLGSRPALFFSRALNKIGDFSYGFYLYAYPIQQIFFLKTNGLELSIYASIFFQTLATTTAAILSWKLVEIKFLNRKTKTKLQPEIL